jgi:hypothetical protein
MHEHRQTCSNVARPRAGGVFVAGREEFPAGDVCVRADFREVANIQRLSRAT